MKQSDERSSQTLESALVTHKLDGMQTNQLLPSRLVSGRQAAPGSTVTGQPKQLPPVRGSSRAESMRRGEGFHQDPTGVQAGCSGAADDHGPTGVQAGRGGVVDLPGPTGVQADDARAGSVRGPPAGTTLRVARKGRGPPAPRDQLRMRSASFSSLWCSMQVKDIATIDRGAKDFRFEPCRGSLQAVTADASVWSPTACAQYMTQGRSLQPYVVTNQRRKVGWSGPNRTGWWVPTASDDAGADSSSCRKRQFTAGEVQTHQLWVDLQTNQHPPSWLVRSQGAQRRIEDRAGCRQL